MAASQPLFSSKQVAAALGASVSSVKRWCDRGSIPTVRTVGGHRRVPLDGLLHFLRDSSYRLANPEAIGLSAQIVSPDVVPDWNSTTEQGRFQQALFQGDERECRAIFWQCFERCSIKALIAEELIAESMHQFGHAWENGQLPVYRERRACEICHRLLYELRLQLDSVVDFRHGLIAIGGTPAGDPYQLASSLIEIALREAGWKAFNQGSDLPLDTLLQAAIEYQPRLFWLSVSVVKNEETFVQQFNQLADALSDDVALLIGGRALGDTLRPRLKYTAHCDNVQQMLGLANALKNSVVAR